MPSQSDYAGEAGLPLSVLPLSAHAAGLVARARPLPDHYYAKHADVMVRGGAWYVCIAVANNIAAVGDQLVHARPISRVALRRRSLGCRLFPRAVSRSQRDPRAPPGPFVNEY